MPNWKYSVDLSVFFEAYSAGQATIQQTASLVCNKLKKLPIEDWQFQDILDLLEDLSKSTDGTVDDFDQIMKELYNFADHDHTLWVNTHASLRQ